MQRVLIKVEVYLYCVVSITVTDSPYNCTNLSISDVERPREAALRVETNNECVHECMYYTVYACILLVAERPGKRQKETACK